MVVVVPEVVLRRLVRRRAAGLVAVVAVFAALMAASAGPAGASEADGLVFTVEWEGDRATGIGPAGVEGLVADGMSVYEGVVPGVAFATVPAGDGMRGLLRLDGPEAPSVYRFANAIPAGFAATVAADGSVVVSGVEGGSFELISAPWAFDAGGMRCRRIMWWTVRRWCR